MDACVPDRHDLTDNVNGYLENSREMVSNFHDVIKSVSQSLACDTDVAMHSGSGGHAYGRDGGRHADALCG
jgi:hypothetical protein